MNTKQAIEQAAKEAKQTVEMIIRYMPASDENVETAKKLLERAYLLEAESKRLAERGQDE